MHLPGERDGVQFSQTNADNNQSVSQLLMTGFI